MNFIKKIVDKKIDNKVHLQFQKFGKGEFLNRAIIEIKKSKENYTIKTSSEFANELVEIVSKELGNNKTKVTGAIITTSNLKDDLTFKGIKQFQGVKKYIIDNEMTGNEIIDLLNKFPKSFFALSFNSGKSILKIKPKAPKSGKPGKDEEKPKADFCSLKTSNQEIAQDFVFEKSNFKKTEISHDFLIEKLTFPEGEKDYSKIREIAKRKGKIIRKAIIDEEKKISEIEFEA